MRKLFLLVFFTVGAMVCHAEQYLSFHGISIHGSLARFTVQLLDDGFVAKGSHEGSVMFSGKSTGREVNVVVYTSASGDMVNGLDVIYKAGNSWETMEALYRELKEGLIHKYGDPTKVSEYWNEEDYEDEYSAMISGELIWKSVFEIKQGRITEHLYKDSFWGNVVVIRYENYDKNAKTNNKSKSYLKDL